MEFVEPYYNIIEYEIDEIIDTDNNIIEVVRHPLQIVKLNTNMKIKENSLMRIKKVDK